MLRTPRVYLTAALAAMLITPTGIFVGALQAASRHVESGTKLLLALNESLNSVSANTGDIVWLHVRSAVSVGDRIAISPGARVKGELISVASPSANPTQRPEIQIRLLEIYLADAGTLSLDAAVLKVSGKQGPPSAGTIAQGLPGRLLSSIISGIKGGGKSAAIGAAVAVLNSGTQASPVSSSIYLPAGSSLDAILERDLDIPEPERLPAFLPDAAPPSAIAPFLDSKMDAPMPAPAGAVTLKVNVNLVQVDAIVRDRSGISMTDLRKEDFRIFEDGVEQQIQKLSREEQPLAVALITDGLSVARNQPPDSGPTDPLAVRVGGPAYQLVRRLKPGDAVSRFSIIDHPKGILQMYEALTTDIQRVARNLDYPPLTRGIVGIRALDYLQEALRYLEVAAPKQRHAVILILTMGYIELGSHASVDQVLKLALNTDTAIYSVEADYSTDGKGMPGVALGSECELYHIRCDSNGMPVYGLPQWPQFLGIPGLPVTQAVRDPVPGIVKQTGGELFTFRPGEFSDIDSVAAGTALAKEIDRSKGYTLSYAPANHPEGSYHRIEVRLADRFGKPSSDYTVQSRTGYYGTASANSIPPGK